MEDVFYHEKYFGDSLTYNRWLPLCARDILYLDRYEDVYGRSQGLSKRNPEDDNNNNKRRRISSNAEIYFFRNHPINYVLITGRCINVKETVLRKKIIPGVLYMFTIDDGSGVSIDCVNFYRTKDLNIFSNEGRILEVRGTIYDAPTFPRRINVSHYRPLRKSIPEQKHLILASMERIDVRRNVLEPGWYCPSAEEEENPVNTFEGGNKETEYCSFNRFPSVLLENREFYLSSIKERPKKSSTQYNPSTSSTEISNNGIVYDTFQRSKNTVHTQKDGDYLPNPGGSMNPIYILSDDRISPPPAGRGFFHLECEYEQQVDVRTLEEDIDILKGKNSIIDSTQMHAKSKSQIEKTTSQINDEFDSLCEDVGASRNFYSDFDSLAIDE